LKITTRLLISFLLAAVIPLALMGYMGLRAMDSIRSLAVQESTLALQKLGEAAIHQKAVDVARQVQLYLEAHPTLLEQPAGSLLADQQLASIAVQPVGQTGYTAVYDRDGVTIFHANPKMAGKDMHELATTLPAFWAIFEASLDGSPSASYYQWEDPDGALREKYMSCVPVGQTRFRVAATTYIDEFSKPAILTETRLNAMFQAASMVLATALVALGVMAVALGLWLAVGLSRPVLAVAQAAAQVEQGHYEAVALQTISQRKDELGQLARHFERMAGQVRAREQLLQRQVRDLRIEIDESRKQRQVMEITETEYFRQLVEKVAQLRARH